MILEIPSGLALLEIFGSEPLPYSSPKDGLWFYTITDHQGITLQLSFNIFERSLQTVLKINERVIQTICLEGFTRLLDARDYKLADGKQLALRGEIEYKNASGILEIFLVPEINIRWSVLVTGD